MARGVVGSEWWWQGGAKLELVRLRNKINIKHFYQYEYQQFSLSVLLFICGPWPVDDSPENKKLSPPSHSDYSFTVYSNFKITNQEIICYNKVHVPQQNQYQEAGH